MLWKPTTARRAPHSPFRAPPLPKGTPHVQTPSSCVRLHPRVRRRGGPSRQRVRLAVAGHPRSCGPARARPDRPLRPRLPRRPVQLRRHVAPRRVRLLRLHPLRVRALRSLAAALHGRAVLDRAPRDAWAPQARATSSSSTGSGTSACTSDAAASSTPRTPARMCRSRRSPARMPPCTTVRFAWSRS